MLLLWALNVWALYNSASYTQNKLVFSFLLWCGARKIANSHAQLFLMSWRNERKISHEHPPFPLFTSMHSANSTTPLLSSSTQDGVTCGIPQVASAKRNDMQCTICRFTQLHFWVLHNFVHIKGGLQVMRTHCTEEAGLLRSFCLNLSRSPNTVHAHV